MGKDVFLTNMGIRIATRRKELSLTQEQLAERMGISLQSISCIELGKKAIRPENLANLCRILDISSDYILLGKRSNQQTSDIMNKLSTLDSASYEAIQNMIELLCKK